MYRYLYQKEEGDHFQTDQQIYELTIPKELASDHLILQAIVFPFFIELFYSLGYCTFRALDKQYLQIIFLRSH